MAKIGRGINQGKQKIMMAHDQPALNQFGGNYRRYQEHQTMQRWKGKVDWRTLKGVPKIKASIVRGQWAVFCPNCNEGYFAEIGEPLFCNVCLNEYFYEDKDVGGKSLEVEFPNAAFRNDLEAELMERPNPINRNWLPDETIQDIIDENLANGIGV